MQDVSHPATPAPPAGTAQTEADDPPRPGEIWRARVDRTGADFENADSENADSKNADSKNAYPNNMEPNDAAPEGAVVVLRCAADAVDYAWLDRDAADGRASLAQWRRQFEVVLEQADHTHATPVRRHWLIDAQAERFRGARVLELGAHTGGLTQSLLVHAAQVTALENNPRCVRLLRQRFGERLRVVAGDMHHALWELPRDGFDVVVCAGVLYHSAHPFLLLEAMAHLRPRAILIDTLDDGVESLHAVVPNLVNSCNYRYNQRPDCGYSVVLGEALIAGAMARLGYGTIQRIDTDAARIAPEHDSAYFRQWRRSLSAWFLRDGAAA